MNQIMNKKAVAILIFIIGFILCHDVNANGKDEIYQGSEHDKNASCDCFIGIGSWKMINLLSDLRSPTEKELHFVAIETKKSEIVCFRNLMCLSVIPGNLWRNMVRYKFVESFKKMIH